MKYRLCALNTITVQYWPTNNTEHTVTLYALILQQLFGVSLSELRTSVTTLQDACVCLCMYVTPYTENLN